jgi:hypothetical protein
LEQVLTPTEDDANSIASPVTFQSDKGQSQSGDTFMFCTYCAELGVLKTFKAKSDWKKHEMRMHETGEDWPCVSPVFCAACHDITNSLLSRLSDAAGCMTARRTSLSTTHDTTQGAHYRQSQILASGYYPGEFSVAGLRSAKM